MLEPNDGRQSIGTWSDPGDGRLIQIAAEAVHLSGLLRVPENAPGLVIIAHGIEDLDRPHRQQELALAQSLYEAGLATFSVDLFSSDELQMDRGTHYFRQNTNIMQQRIVGTAEWFSENPDTANLSIGYFGLNEVGASALWAAASRPDIVAAVVAAGEHLVATEEFVSGVISPTLFLAAGGSEHAVKANQELATLVAGEKQLATIPGVAGLFETPQASSELRRQVSDWFQRWLVAIV